MMDWLGGVIMTADKDRLIEIFLIEKIGVDLGNIRSTLNQLRDHVLLNGDVRTRVTLDVAVKRLQDIQDDARRASVSATSNSLAASNDRKQTPEPEESRSN